MLRFCSQDPARSYRGSLSSCGKRKVRSRTEAEYGSFRQHKSQLSYYGEHGLMQQIPCGGLPKRSCGNGEKGIGLKEAACSSCCTRHRTAESHVLRLSLRTAGISACRTASGKRHRGRVR